MRLLSLVKTPVRTPEAEDHVEEEAGEAVVEEEEEGEARPTQGPEVAAAEGTEPTKPGPGRGAGTGWGPELEGEAGAAAVLPVREPEPEVGGGRGPGQL